MDTNLNSQRTATDERRPFSSGPSICVLALAIPLLFTMAPEILAQSPSQDIHQQLSSLQSQLDQLKAQQGFDAISNPHVQLPNFQHPVSAELTEPNTYPTARITGFFQADAGWFHQEVGNVAAVGDIQDGADFRRARLAATGDVWDNVKYMVEFDFATPGRPNFMDVWLQMQDIAGGNVRIGQFRHPFGMDGLTSVKELTFLERGLPFAFLPFRQIGAMYQTHSEGELMTWAISGFRFPTDAFGGNVGDNGGYGLATRLTALLIDGGNDGVLHIGGGYSFGDPANDVVRYRNQPEFFVAETGGAGLVPGGVPTNVPPFVDTGLIPANNFNLLNAELGASSGALHAQAEVFFAMVNQQTGPNLTFPGAYAQIGYILTGESRPYNRKAGVFGRVVPNNPFGNGGTGAWEVAGRWSYIDLNDANIQGGRLNDLTFGLNWYLNKHTKFQFNYIHAFLGSSSATSGPVITDSNADIIALRAQIDF